MRRLRVSFGFYLLLALTLFLAAAGVSSARASDSSPQAESSRIAFAPAPRPAPDEQPAQTTPRLRRAGISHLNATPAVLPASGGGVHLRAVVYGATRCLFSSAREVNGLPSIRRCKAGRASTKIELLENTTSSTETYILRLTVRGLNGARTTRRVNVSVDGQTTTRPAPTVAVVAPAITTQPTNQSVMGDQDATFTAYASGNPTPSVQWQFSTDGGGSWGNIAGATSTSYTFMVNANDNSYEYRAVFTNVAGSTPSNAATLSVPTAPAITTQPTNQSVMGDQDATFTAYASGNPTPSVQWQFSTDGGGSWGNIAGATSTSYTFMVNANDNSYEYRAVFTNVAGSIPTNAATLSVPPDSTSNMSGYFEYSIPYGTTFSQVRASWTVPTVSCPPGANTWAAEWPGIGYGTSVAQDGTQVACFSGVPNYSAWYELVGDSSVNGGNAVGLSASTYPVSPGDAITASVGITGSTWTLSLEDATQGWTFTFSTPSPTPALQQESAEVTVEGPFTVELLRARKLRGRALHGGLGRPQRSDRAALCVLANRGADDKRLHAAGRPRPA